MASTSTSDSLTPGRVRRLLRQSGRSQAETARAAGVGEAELSRIVARSMRPTSSQARRLLEVLAPGDDTARTPVKLEKV
jgi:predicted transcriptional regulator